MKETISLASRPVLSNTTQQDFEQLHLDVRDLHVRWKFFCQLYADETGERVALLRWTANDFFLIVQWLFLNDVCLSLSRLTDPETQGGRTNLVLETLVSQLRSEPPGDPIIGTLTDLLAKAKQATKPFRDLRNRSIGHRDLPTSLNPNTMPLPGISRQAVEEALAAVVAFIDAFHGWYTNSTVRYRFPNTENDGRWLLWALQRARAYAELEEQGKVPSIDIPHLHTGLSSKG